MAPQTTTSQDGKFLCLTILGYKKEGMSEEAYRHHMTQVSAPMTKDLMVKYGIIRWVQIHNQAETRAMMSQLYDPQMAKVADFNCFSQVTFRRLEDYKRFKQDPVYKQRLTGDHENFADTKRSCMTIGWVEQFINEGVVVDGFEDPAKSTAGWTTAGLIAGSFLSGAMVSLSGIAIPVFLDTTKTAADLYTQWARTYHYGHLALPALSIGTFLLHSHAAANKARAGKRWQSSLAAGLVTMVMIPFTWVVMSPTNDKLFALAEATKAGVLTSGLGEAKELVAKWSMMHLARSLFPLAGATIGSMVLLRKLF
ncbi:hypothetical protein BJ166DRAFT_593937 [Pestalotiopsis sp. NC0098]|nr:hypothetical protein BJ166DRAFT_593937 [Pestalotiopsis sp. NC0098]